MTTTPAIDKRANLAKLAAYLTALPVDYAAFDMGDFLQPVSQRYLDKINDEWRNTEAKYARENGGVAQCGSVACAVGHGPTAGILALPEHFTKTHDNSDIRTVDWFAYTRTFFLDYAYGVSFEWMFGGGWSNFDNTHHGAAERIRYYLEHGVPEDFDPSWVDFEDFVEVYANA